VECLGRVWKKEDLAGGDPTVNADIVKEVLSGRPGACRDIVVLNSALAIMAGEKAEGIREGIALAEECIESRAAIKKLQALIELSNS